LTEQQVTYTRRPGAFTVRGHELTALGEELRPGDEAPDAVLAGKGFVPAPVRISDYRGRVLILSCVPSLDTPTCDRETRHWEGERRALGGDIEMLTVSVDLVFAQARWCGAAEVTHQTASAYMNPRFGIDYGILLEENRLLGRAVFVIDREGRIRHAQYVREIAEEPDYAPVLAGVDTDVREIELEVFSAEATDPSERIYRLTREVLEFHRAAAPLLEPLHRLAANRFAMVAPSLQEYFRDVLDHLHRVVDEINDQTALLSSMLDAHLARVTQAQTEVTLRQNEDVRKISAWAAILAVPTMIAGIYGMNFEHMPELTWKFGYPLVLGVIVAACFGVYRLFRRSGWI